MMALSNLKNFSKRKRKKKVGRGVGSNKGKTCCRGHKGDKSRSGYKRRAGKEGGQLPLYQKLPHRGFSNARFAKKILTINLDRVNEIFEDGETLSRETLFKKGFSVRRLDGIKILSNGEITKKIVILATHFSKMAIRKLEEKGIEFKIV